MWLVCGCLIVWVVDGCDCLLGLICFKVRLRWVVVGTWREVWVCGCFDLVSGCVWVSVAGLLFSLRLFAMRCFVGDLGVILV